MGEKIINKLYLLDDSKYLKIDLKNLKYKGKEINEAGELLCETQENIKVCNIVKKNNKFYIVEMKINSTSDNFNCFIVNNVDFKTQPVVKEDEENFECCYCAYIDEEISTYTQEGYYHCPSCNSIVSLDIRKNEKEVRFTIKPILIGRIVDLDNCLNN